MVAITSSVRELVPLGERGRDRAHAHRGWRSRDGMRYIQIAGPTPSSASATWSQRGRTKNAIDAVRLTAIIAIAKILVRYLMLRCSPHSRTMGPNVPLASDASWR